MALGALQQLAVNLMMWSRGDRLAAEFRHCLPFT